RAPPDFGLWTAVEASRLLIPVDTHVENIARSIGLTRRKSRTWRMAEEITGRLAEIDPADPVKYDFALCHKRMSGDCRDRRDVVGLQQRVATELKGVSSEVSRQLQAGMKLIQSAQATMGDRLDSAAKVVGEVQGSLGKLGEATQRVVEVGKEIQGLEQILKSPKVRGGLGETLLGELLAQMLPREHYELQRLFKSGERVDAAIRLAGRLVPVDAKFPLENFRRMLAEPEEERRRPVRKQFARDVKTRI